MLFYQIDKEREGEQIDRALLKNVIDIFVEIGMGQMDAYEADFEAHMLNDTGEYYSRKASNWILEDSCPDYMLKASLPFRYTFRCGVVFQTSLWSYTSFGILQAEECLRRERDRVSHYLHSSSEQKLVEVS